MSGKNPVLAVAVACGLAFAASGCTSEPPSILTIGELEVEMNTLVEFDVAATDPDTDELVFSMKDAPKGAKLNVIAGKLAKFTWTPNPAQTGPHTITFVASDGTNVDEETITLTVKGGGAPKLVSKDPPRYVVDLSTGPSVKFTLEYRDDDTAELEFQFNPDPTEWGAEVRAQGKKVSFTWEPSPEQKAIAQHSFVVDAIDQDGAKASHTVAIIFRGAQTGGGGGGGNTSDECPEGTTAPVVLPKAIPNQNGDEEYEVVADVADADSDIQYATVFYSTVVDPQDGDWQHVQLEETGERAEWAGFIPNLDLGPGESATVTWQVCAADDDDDDGDFCDSWACSEMFTFTASASLGLCDPCQTGQCGENICIVNQRTGDKFCGGTCGTSDTCAAGFRCYKGLSKPQCIPQGCFDASGAIQAGSPDCSCAAGRPTAPLPGEVVVNEILFDPPDACPEGQATCDASAKLSVDINGDGVRLRDEGQEEFIELVNKTSTKYLQLQGMTIADSDKVRFTFPTFVLPPGRAVLVFGGGDATKYGALGGAFKFSAAAVAGATTLQLNNSGDKVVLMLGTATIDSVTWGSTVGKTQSIVRPREGDATSTLANHSTAPAASGAKWSPGTHTCGTPFPLDAEACVAPSCTIRNQDKEPESNTRSTAPCLQPLPQTIATTTLKANQANASDNDTKDYFVIEGVAGRWLHARTEAGTAPAIGDTVLKLLSRNGTQVATNDDDEWDAFNLYSRLIYQFPSDGIYYLEVSPFVEGTAPVTGSYKLVVETASTEPQG